MITFIWFLMIMIALVSVTQFLTSFKTTQDKEKEFELLQEHKQLKEEMSVIKGAKRPAKTQKLSDEMVTNIDVSILEVISQIEKELEEESKSKLQVIPKKCKHTGCTNYSSLDSSDIYFVCHDCGDFLRRKTVQHRQPFVT